MAWPRKQPNGLWMGCYRDANGDTRSAGIFESQPEAHREAAAIEAALRRPGALDPGKGKITWGNWFTLWMDSRMVSTATDTQYRSRAANHVLPYWEDTPLNDIQGLEISRWMVRLNKAGRSPWVIDAALTMFKASLNAAVADKRLPESPAAGIPRPDLPKGTDRFLSPDEVEAIAFFMDGPNALVFLTLVTTGLRFGELAGLHWAQVDLDRGVLRVLRQLNARSGTMTVPKDKDERTVPLDTDVAAKLAMLRERAPRPTVCGIEHEGERCPGGDIVFRGARGAPLSAREWGRGPFKRAIEMARIEGRVRVHDCRHTYASWLLQEGQQIPEVAKLMGHSKWETLKRYSHFDDSNHPAVRAALTRKRGQGRTVEPDPDAGSTAWLVERLTRLEDALNLRDDGDQHGAPGH